MSRPRGSRSGRCVLARARAWDAKARTVPRAVSEMSRRGNALPGVARTFATRRLFGCGIACPGADSADGVTAPYRSLPPGQHARHRPLGSLLALEHVRA